MNSIVIDLQELQQKGKTQISLANEPKEVIFKGEYTGARITISEHSGKDIVFVDGFIDSTHPEDALAFNGRTVNCGISSEGFKVTNGGLHFWEAIEKSTIESLEILYAHTGIRCNKDWRSENVVIRNNKIFSASHEGIYFGDYRQEATKRSAGIYITQNKIKSTGWDHIQVGNADPFFIWNNDLEICGQSGRRGQWHPITINPNSLGFYWDNRIYGTYLNRGVATIKATSFAEMPLDFDLDHFDQK